MCYHLTDPLRAPSCWCGPQCSPGPGWWGRFREQNLCAVNMLLHNLRILHVLIVFWNETWNVKIRNVCMSWLSKSREFDTFRAPRDENLRVSWQLCSPVLYVNVSLRRRLKPTLECGRMIQKTIYTVTERGKKAAADFQDGAPLFVWSY